MKSIEELQADLKKIYSELEERRLMEQESIPQTINFDELSSKAERYKIENHPLGSRDERTQKMYLLTLLSVIALDSTSYEKSFSFLYRISHGMGFNGDIQELFLQAQQMNFTRIDEITRLFINDDVRLLMLMECIIIAAGFEKEKKRALEYISELCILMKLEKNQIIFISNIARVILTQNVKEYNCNMRNTYSVFDCYLSVFSNKELGIRIIKMNSDYFECNYSNWFYIYRQREINKDKNNNRDMFIYDKYLCLGNKNYPQHKDTIHIFNVNYEKETCVYSADEVESSYQAFAVLVDKKSLITSSSIAISRK